MSFDAIIIGARPAGASMAALLSKAGFRVLLTDRVTFPKPTLSCPLYFANTFALLDRIGVMPQVDGFGAPKLRRYQVELDDIHLFGRMLPYRGFDYAYHIRRELFDEMLLNHVAKMPNVETRLGFKVTDLVREGERVIGVRGRREGGAEEEIRAGAVVGADGVFSTVASLTHAPKYNIVPARTCVHYAYYRDVALPGPEPSAALYYDTRESFAFITASGECNLTVISLSLPASKFEWARARRDSLHPEFAKKKPALEERMKDAKRVSPVYGVGPRESFYRVPYGHGWVLVGDAAYYKDPLPGQGIYDALRSTELAAHAFVEYRAGGSSGRAWDTAFAKYHAARDRESGPMYELTDFLAHLDSARKPQEMDLFRALAALPDWTDRFVSIFNGATDVKWFRRFDTLGRILLAWRWKQLKQRVRG